DWMHEAEIGTLAENTVREVWQGPVMAALRQAHLSGDFGSHSFCGKCPDWSVISWPGTGRSYADLMRDLSSSGVAPIPA
ncbi:SPASM domain-containing protein, partial [Acinetobacter baumannii]